MARTFRTLGYALLALFAAGLLAGPTMAGEKQKIALSSELTDAAFNEADMPEGSATKVYYGIMIGQAGDKEGDASLQGASVHKFWTGVFAEGQDPKVVGVDAYTFPNGSEIYIEFRGLPSSMSSDGKGRGEWTVSSGSGDFEGLKGRGRYTYYPKTDTTGTKVLEGEIERAAMTN